MPVWGEVSYKVKRAITFRERFSVAELVDATDLTYSQVEQVVQRLIQQQYVRPLESHELKPAEQTAQKRVGRPRKRYTLIEDPAKRGQLYAEVEAIASAERMSRAKDREPSTPFFTHALQIIQAMERGKESVCTARLEEAEQQLTAGRDFEGLIPEGAEVVQAHYDSAMARLKALQEDYSSADELLAQAEEAFQMAGSDEQAQEITDLRLALNASRILAETRELIERQIDPGPALEDLKCLVREFSSPTYLLLPLQKTVEAIDAVISTAAREMLVALQANTWFRQQNTERVRRVALVVEGGESEFEIAARPMTFMYSHFAVHSPRAHMKLSSKRMDPYSKLFGKKVVASRSWYESIELPSKAKGHLFVLAEKDTIALGHGYESV